MCYTTSLHPGAQAGSEGPPPSGAPSLAVSGGRDPERKQAGAGPKQRGNAPVSEVGHRAPDHGALSGREVGGGAQRPDPRRKEGVESVTSFDDPLYRAFRRISDPAHAELGARR